MVASLEAPLSIDKDGNELRIEDITPDFNSQITFEEYENLCFGRVNDKIKVVDSIKTFNEKLHSDGINEKLRRQFVGTCLLALKNGLVYKAVKETLDPKIGKKVEPVKVVLKSIKDILQFIDDSNA